MSRKPTSMADLDQLIAIARSAVDASRAGDTPKEEAAFDRFYMWKDIKGGMPDTIEGAE